MRGSLALKLCLSLVAVAAAAAPATAATLSASPSAVNFQYSPGEPELQPVFVDVTASDGSSPVLTVTVTPGIGTPAALFPQPIVENLDTIQVYFDDATFNSLPPGIYTATITITATGFAALAIPVTFSIDATISIIPSPTSLTFDVPSGPTVQTVALSGTNGAVVGFSLSSSTSPVGGKWLSATASPSSTPATLTVTINPVNLPAGTYTGSVAVTPSSGAALVIPVSLQVKSIVLAASPASISGETPK